MGGTQHCWRFELWVLLQDVGRGIQFRPSWQIHSRLPKNTSRPAKRASILAEMTASRSAEFDSASAEHSCDVPATGLWLLLVRVWDKLWEGTSCWRECHPDSSEVPKHLKARLSMLFKGCICKLPAGASAGLCLCTVNLGDKHAGLSAAQMTASSSPACQCKVTAPATCQVDADVCSFAGSVVEGCVAGPVVALGLLSVWSCCFSLSTRVRGLKNQTRPWAASALPNSVSAKNTAGTYLRKTLTLACSRL